MRKAARAADHGSGRAGRSMRHVFAMLLAGVVMLCDARLGLTELDEALLDIIRPRVEQGLDFLALSFVRSDRDVHQLRDWLANLDARIPIVAKIEKPGAIAAFDDILACSDAVMIARGDLGIEIPAEFNDLNIEREQKYAFRIRVRQGGIPVATGVERL